jgi:exodeoxyribonuclease VII small subunit
VSGKPENPSAKQPSFEEALSLLETIVQELEEGQIPLAEGLARYEEGVKLLKQCYQLLERAERHIEVLNHVDSDGNAACEPFDDGALSLEEKAQTRGRRRSRGSSGDPPPAQDDMDSPGRLF